MIIDRSVVYPVSAVLADRDVMLCIKPGEHGSTYGGYVSYTTIIKSSCELTQAAETPSSVPAQ